MSLCKIDLLNFTRKIEDHVLLGKRKNIGKIL